MRGPNVGLSRVSRPASRGDNTTARSFRQKLGRYLPPTVRDWKRASKGEEIEEDGGYYGPGQPIYGAKHASN